MKRTINRSNLLVWRALLVCVVVLLCPVDPIQGGERSEDPSEFLVRKIARDLRCAVCQNQSVYESNSDLARDMLVIVREKVRAGEPEASIRHYFFERYGDYIYLEPTQDGKNWVLWLAPFFGLLVGGAALWMALTRWKRETVTPDVSVADAVETQEVKDRIQKALDRVQL